MPLGVGAVFFGVVASSTTTSMCVAGHDVLARDVTLAFVGGDVVLTDFVTGDVVLAVGGIFAGGGAVMLGEFTLAAVAFGLAGTDVSVGDAWGCAVMLADPVATDLAFAGGAPQT